MGKLRRLRSDGFLGIFSKLSQLYWSAKSSAYYGPHFASFGRGTTIRKPLLIRNPRAIVIGARGSIRDGVRLEVVDRDGEEPGRLVIGHNVNLEQHVHIVAGGLIEIGDDVCIAARTTILDCSHPLGQPGDGNRVNLVSSGPAFVKIGKRVFIGAGSVIMPNVSIGDNSVVGANSVVTKNVPPNCVVAGAPARVIREIPVAHV